MLWALSHTTRKSDRLRKPAHMPNTAYSPNNVDQPRHPKIRCLYCCREFGSSHVEKCASDPTRN